MMSERNIAISQTSRSHPLEFQVAVSTQGTTTEHLVSVSRPHLESLTHSRYSARQLIEASILFLLDREPKESMLRRFDVTLIPRYFPEFELQLPHYLALVADRVSPSVR